MTMTIFVEYIAQGKSVKTFKTKRNYLTRLADDQSIPFLFN